MKRGDRDKFRSTSDIRSQSNEGEKSFQGETKNRQRNDSSTSGISSKPEIVTEEVKQSEKKKNRARKKKKKSPELAQTQSQPQDCGKETEAPSYRLTKACITIMSPFANSSALKEIISQLMNACEETFSLQFVEESIIVNEKRGVCTVVIQAASKQLGKRLIKTVCTKLRKTLKTSVTYDISSMGEGKSEDEDDPSGTVGPQSRSAHQKSQIPQSC